MTVLVAPNGQGKTAILDALRIALWPFVNAFDVASGTLPRSGIELDDVRLVRTRTKRNAMEPQLPSNISARATHDGSDLAWSRQRDKVSARSKTTVREARPLVDMGAKLQAAIRIDAEDETELTKSPNTPLPIIAYYGTGRLWKQRQLTQKNQSRSDFFSRTFAYVGCLDTGSNYKYFIDWFYYLYAADFEQKAKKVETEGFQGLYDEDYPYEDCMKAIRDAVDKVMEQRLGWKNLSYSPSQKALVMEHDEYGVLKVDQLSDGLRNMIAMTADIAYRCSRLNPQWSRDAAIKTEGIVLIDEIDMHLHPSWQQTILQSFQSAFPEIQFIVTTHSPQVLTTVPRENIRVIEWIDDGHRADKPDFSPLAHESGDALAKIMETHREPELALQDSIRNYEQLVRTGKEESDDALELRRKLDKAGYQIHESDLATWRFLAARKSGEGL